MFEDTQQQGPQRVNVEDYLLDMTIQRTKPKTRLRINGEDAIYNGSISLIGGDRKQGKSQTLVIMAAVMMSRRPFGAVSPGEADTKGVLWIDTEQNDWFQSRNVRRLYSLMGVPPDTPTQNIGLNYLGLYGLAPEQQFWAMQDAVALWNPDLLIVDQLGDFAVDTNDNVESAALLGEMLMLTREHPDTAVVVALHNNPGSNKARGHIGSELERKCAEKWEPKRNEDGTFTVKCAFSRGKDPDPWGFEFDPVGLLRPTDITAKKLEELTLDDIIPGATIKFTSALDKVQILTGHGRNRADDIRPVLKQWLEDRRDLWVAQGLVKMDGNFIERITETHRQI